MKKLLLGLVLSFALLLGACGNDEAEKKDDNKKSESVEKKKEAPKKSESKKDTAKKENESTEQTEQVATEEPQSQEQQPQQVEQPVQQEDNPSDAEIEAMREQSKQSSTGLQTEPSQGELPADLNEHEEQNTNMNGEHVVSPGWTQEEQSQAYEEYEKGKEAQAQAGVIPGEEFMDLSDEE